MYVSYEGVANYWFVFLIVKLYVQCPHALQKNKERYKVDHLF